MLLICCQKQLKSGLSITRKRKTGNRYIPEDKASEQRKIYNV